MNVECVKEKISKVVSKAEKITSKNPSLPVLSCLLLETKNNELIISSTNLDIGIEITIPAKISKEGKIAVPAQIFSQFISSLFNDKSLILDSDGQNLKITTEHSESQIKVMPTDDFPSLPKVSGTTNFTLHSKDLLKGLKSVFYAASNSTIKPALSSVYIYPENDDLVFAATDSFRLAEKRIKLKKPVDFDHILLPLKNIPEIIRSFEDVDDEISVLIEQNQIAFAYNGVYLTSRLVDAVFPDYKQIIPKEEKTSATVLKFDLVNCLKMSNIFADKFSQVYFSLSEKPKKFEIKTKNADVGENTSILDAVVKGEAVTLSFNYKYIVDSFQSVESDSVTLQFTDANRAMVMRGTNDKSFLYLVMPMNK